ncbi:MULTISPECIES: hypothetical protein [Xanthomonas]|uniref:hypothetical protein n=1 Tax=Xanthomonas TaxID=338 RepID=UPI00114D039A|nr:hypothetical protein [Xanthomonas campestris]MCC5044982.1 hypothetical protein [Xanthomonas campestris]MCC5047023.1 hypothetical protein [Xanthomonas campestris]MCC5056503.1 hypothetical protein [Xanthomonas campestris]MCC5060686.1 hypothetical protein [Xanthomonas campestris]MCC5096596.1 hypothetical protein [Xanthomonas campestris]
MKAVVENGHPIILVSDRHTHRARLQINSTITRGDGCTAALATEARCAPFFVYRNFFALCGLTQAAHNPNNETALSKIVEMLRNQSSLLSRKIFMKHFFKALSRWIQVISGRKLGYIYGY